MSNSEFVLWYIDKLYLFTGSSLKRKYSIDTLTFSEFVGEVKSSLGVNIVDRNDMYNFLYNWYSNKKKEAKIDLLDYIKFKYKVALGPTNWEINNMGNKQIKIKDIVHDLKKQYDLDFISEVVEEWFENEIINISEKLILNFN